MKETTVFVSPRLGRFSDLRGLFAASLLTPACALSDASTDPVAETSAEIQRGVRETGRVPIVSYGTICTATFVARARCLITASHCSGGYLVMGPDANGSLQDPNLRTSYSRRSLSLRDFTTAPRYQGGSFDSSPADDIRILGRTRRRSPGRTPSTIGVTTLRYRSTSATLVDRTATPFTVTASSSATRPATASFATARFAGTASAT